MSISIRNPKAEKLARQVAATAHESMTQAIIHALEERLERLKWQRKVPDLEAEIHNIAKRCGGLPEGDRRPPDEILGYDIDGIPR